MYRSIRPVLDKQMKGMRMMKGKNFLYNPAVCRPDGGRYGGVLGRLAVWG